jgi:hypothetical protein
MADLMAEAEAEASAEEWGGGGDSINHIIVQDCDISYIGGGDQNGDYGTRFGNGFECYDECNNIIVRRNKISQ